MSSTQHSPQVWNAALYDGAHSFVWKHGADLIELLSPRAGERVLDLGCGTGHLTQRIAETGAHVIGIDSAPSMIEQARAAYPDLRFEVADARDFNFEAPFNAVFSNATLHWVKDARAAAGRIAQALKPGGRLVAEFGGKGNVALIVQALQAALKSAGHDGPSPHPWYFPGVAEYAALLEEAGLEVVFAALFDRPTPLEGEAGMRAWIEMFGGAFVNVVPPARREAFLKEAEQRLRSVAYRGGTWFADYRRLRLVAHK